MIENPVLTFAVMVLIIVFLVLACAFVYLTTPNKFRFFNMPTAYCHRGFHDEVLPENSLGAFAKSAEHGLGVELDVRPTKDGKVVVFHDANVKRMCGVDKLVRDMTFDELSELRLKGTEYQIPLFSAALETCGGVPVSCEIKSDSPAIECDFLEDVYQILKDYNGDINVISFNPLVLKWFKENHPEIIRGQLASASENLGISKFAYFSLSNLLTNFLAKPDFISYRFTDKSLGFLLCRFYGTRLCAWTVRSMDDVEHAAFEGFSTFVGENFDITEV